MKMVVIGRNLARNYTDKELDIIHIWNLDITFEATRANNFFVGGLEDSLSEYGYHSIKHDKIKEIRNVFPYYYLIGRD